MTLPHPLITADSGATATPLPRVLRPQRAVPSDAVRPTRAEINLAALRHNLRILQRVAGGAEVCCVLKADGYGHGSKAVARTLERAGATRMCVALMEEGVELRQAGIRAPILVMGGHYDRAWGELLRYDLTPVIHEAGQIATLAEEVRFSGAGRVGAHLKIDTGMARLGVMPNEVPDVAKALRRFKEVRLEGVMTHFACADADDVESVDHQLDIFDESCQGLLDRGIDIPLRHAANSAATIRCARARLNAVRPGIALFGVTPQPEWLPELRPVMRVASEIIALREIQEGMTVGYGATWKAKRTSRIATLPMGYADGLTRGLSNKGSILVRGQRAPIVGVVSMDMTMIDVTEIDDVAMGDECVVLGSQKGPKGEAAITATEIADQLGTIPWEVLTSVSRRVPRFYREP